MRGRCYWLTPRQDRKNTNKAGDLDDDGLLLDPALGSVNAFQDDTMRGEAYS